MHTRAWRRSLLLPTVLLLAAIGALRPTPALASVALRVTYAPVTPADTRSYADAAPLSGLDISWSGIHTADTQPQLTFHVHNCGTTPLTPGAVVVLADAKGAALMQRRLNVGALSPASAARLDVPIDRPLASGTYIVLLSVRDEATGTTAQFGPARVAYQGAARTAPVASHVPTPLGRPAPQTTSAADMAWTLSTGALRWLGAVLLLLVIVVSLAWRFRQHASIAVISLPVVARGARIPGEPRASGSVATADPVLSLLRRLDDIAPVSNEAVAVAASDRREPDEPRVGEGAVDDLAALDGCAGAPSARHTLVPAKVARASRLTRADELLFEAMFAPANGYSTQAIAGERQGSQRRQPASTATSAARRARRSDAPPVTSHGVRDSVPRVLWSREQPWA
jgi:hypothetical protein